jgi:KaiC/GvpD/RAD55 family RecA-like ATPase
VEERTADLGTDLQALVDEILDLYAERVREQGDTESEDVDVESQVAQMDKKVRAKMVDAGV